MNLFQTLHKILTEDVPAAAFMFKRARMPFKKYEGSEKEITNTIIKQCFTGEFFQVSLGHFPQFYMRDFGMVVKSLCELGYTKECQKTVQYALTEYIKQKRVSTTIDSKGRCVDFFAYGPDSFGFLLHSIRVTKTTLTKAQKVFLAKQAIICKDKVWDEKHNGVKTNTYFSTSKDHYKRNASCYDFCMVGWISQSLDKLNIENPFKKTDFTQRLIELYWSGDAFYDDLDKDEFSGDAQTFPFYCEILSVKKHKAYVTSAIKKVQELKLDDPFPLKYTATRNTKKELFLPALLAPNYEGDAIWIHTGLCYLEVVQKVDSQLLRKYLTLYGRNLAKYQNFLEVYDKNGVPYRSFWYKCDESMLWVSMYYNMSRKMKSLA